uniref:Cns1/TTC4 wheel domain-containing protein n=1 Tax=Timema poppense TaxID=170557 RepID=A0A7R9DG20_TIMPO|nr:unnamed protein product [Timema poppensis]
MESNVTLTTVDAGLPDHSSEGRVHLSGVSLVWPVMFLYPEHETTDLIEEFHEDTTFREHLELMFESPPEWDKERKYVLERLLVYWEDQETRRLHPVDKATTLRQVLAHRRYVVVAGRPSFLVLAEGSEAQKRQCSSRRKQLPVKHCENSTWLVAFVSMLTKTSRKVHSHPSQCSDRSILGHVNANEIIKGTSQGDAAA